MDYELMGIANVIARLVPRKYFAALIPIVEAKNFDELNKAINRAADEVQSLAVEEYPQFGGQQCPFCRMTALGTPGIYRHVNLHIAKHGCETIETLRKLMMRAFQGKS
jgi:hypothetical protein